IRQSKVLPYTGQRIQFICSQPNGNLLLKTTLITRLVAEGYTHATQLIESGINAKGVAARLGHANATITQNLYSHNTLKLQEEAAANFDKILQTKL
ncbi:MAG: site-specific integrase, partial [Selenomonadaceae bacterium]|nr:site-specific integrase [Selenomonadaceae bacterium]